MPYETLRLKGYIDYSDNDQSNIYKADSKRIWVPGGVRLKGYIDYSDNDQSNIYKADSKRIWVPGGVRLKGYIDYSDNDQSNIYKADIMRIVFVTLVDMHEKFNIILTVEQPFGIPWMQEEIVTSAWCWKIVRTDGVVMGFTSHDEDISYGGIVYKANTGFAPTAVSTSNDLSVDNLDAQGMISDESITVEDIKLGKYDNAQIEVFLVNYSNLKDEIFVLRRGNLGEVTYGKNGFVSEVRGLMENYQAKAGKVCQKTCRTYLGSNLCKIDLAAFTFTGNVLALNDDGSFATDLYLGEDYFSYGMISWLSGNNLGAKIEVKKYSTDGVVQLFLPMANNIAIGDKFEIVAGCDGNATTCRNRFNNLNNFRGEPYVMGNFYAASYPNSDSGNIVSGGNDVRLGAYLWGDEPPVWQGFIAKIEEYQEEVVNEDGETVTVTKKHIYIAITKPEGSFADNYFNGKLIKLRTGERKGYSYTIKSYAATGLVTFNISGIEGIFGNIFLKFAVGDKFSIS